jgi:hypothetical protein
MKWLERRNFKEGLIDLVFKKAKNRKEAGDNPHIQIPKGETVINRCSFAGDGLRYGVKNIIIPKGIIRICDYAFLHCFKLKNLVIHEGVSTIGVRSFEKCINLKNIYLPKSVTSIGDYAFETCIRLKYIIIPNGVTNIGHFILQECNSLESITIPEKYISLIHSGTLTNSKRFIFTKSYIFNYIILKSQKLLNFNLPLATITYT